MAELAIVASVISAVSQIEAGQARGRMYHLQAEQVSLEGKQNALREEQKANLVLQKLNETNAAAVARGAAGGVQAFEGSAALIQQTNLKRAGKEFQISMETAAGAERMGEVQKQMYADAANQAERAGYFNAAATLAMGGYQYSQIGAAPSTVPAPIETRTWKPLG